YRIRGRLHGEEIHDRRVGDEADRAAPRREGLAHRLTRRNGDLIRVRRNGDVSGHPVRVMAKVVHLVWAVDNGTFINDQRLVPAIGLDRRLLLQDRAIRCKYGLPAGLPMAKLGAPGADQVNYLRHDADWVTADI